MNLATWVSFLGIMCFTTLLRAQTGTEFWFGAPEVSSGHADNPVYLRICDIGLGSTVTIDQPANSSFTPIVVTLTANGAENVDLTSNLADLEHTVPDAVVNKGLRIVATNPITAYYEVATSVNTDIFTLKGDNALGTTFFIPAQTHWENHDDFSPSPKSGFIVVATENNTTVTITPSKNIEGHSGGTPFTITLDRGQSYSAQAVGEDGDDHLGGSKVVSDKPVVVTLFDDSAYNASSGWCRDLMGDQLIPVSALGDAYILIKGFLGFLGLGSDRVYVLAATNNTNVYINGSGTPSATLDAGDQYEYVLSSNVVYITSSEPVVILHVTGYGCEVGMAVVPTVYCAGSEEVKFTRSTSESFYLIVLVPNGFTDDFILNGNTTYLQASDFTVVPNTGGNWYYCRKSFNTTRVPVGTTSTIENTGFRFQMGIINGGSSTGCRYGYFSNFNKTETGSIIHY